MPTEKTRINITVPAGLDAIMEKLARRDRVSLSAKALELLRRALEIEEDATLLTIANQREKSASPTTYLSHQEVWE